MAVVAVQTVGQFVGDGFADQRRAGIEQGLNRRCGARRRRVRRHPSRITGACDAAGEVEQILSAEGEASKPSRLGARDGEQAVGTEGAYAIASPVHGAGTGRHGALARGVAR
jgi:hypothetical protein